MAKKEDSVWRRRARRAAFVAIVLQLVGIVLFVAILLIGERSRFTLIALYLPRQPLLIAAIAAALLVRFARRHVKILLPLQIVLCLVLLFPVMGFNIGTSRHVDKALRLATYNVYFAKLGRAALYDEIQEMDVDIILIQAAHSSMGERLKDRFPKWTIHQEKEFVLLSRFPVLKVETPPNLPDGDPAMYMKYILDTPQGELKVYSIHPYSPRHALFDNRETGENIANREGQIEAAVSAARSDVPPFIIAGDTNLPPLSGIGRRHLGGLKDAFEDVGFGFGYTFTAKYPWMRIDRAFGSGIRFADVRVGARGNSDHRPLFVNFEIEK